VKNLRRTYGSYLDLAARLISRRDALLEIGCGNGFFLEEALARGWRTVQGVEPGREAAAAANEAVRQSITCAMMRPGLFPRESFDLVCMFQVFDHFPDPAGILNACREALRPGGLVLAINHNVEAMSARLLGERSPVFDIEHTFLWSPRTMSRVFFNGGFEQMRSGAVYNRFSLGYLARLAPLPGALKRATLALLEGSGLGRMPLTLPLGNLYFIGRKAMEPSSR
jgi:SAM-dependent methyltransferase